MVLSLFGLLIYMNFVIIKTIRRSRKMFLNNSTSTGTEHIQIVSAGLELRKSTMKNAENQLTIMLLLVTTLFLILLLPSNVRFVYLTFLKPDTPSKYALSTFLMQLTYKLYTTNSGINFCSLLHQWTKIQKRFEGNIMFQSKFSNIEKNVTAQSHRYYLSCLDYLWIPRLVCLSFLRYSKISEGQGQYSLVL